jgi:hypothetical protein
MSSLCALMSSTQCPVKCATSACSNGSNTSVRFPAATDPGCAAPVSWPGQSQRVGMASGTLVRGSAMTGAAVAGST